MLESTPKGKQLGGAPQALFSASNKIGGGFPLEKKLNANGLARMVGKQWRDKVQEDASEARASIDSSSHER